MNYRKGLAKKIHMSPCLFWHTEQFCHIFTPVDQLLCSILHKNGPTTYNEHFTAYNIMAFVCAGWLHEVQWVLCIAFWSMDMTGVYACLFEAVCDVTTVPSHLKVENNSLELTRIFKESFKDQRWAWEKSVRAEKRDRDAEREKETFRRQRHHQTDDGVDAETSLSLSLCISISLLRPYTFSHAHLWSLKLSLIQYGGYIHIDFSQTLACGWIDPERQRRSLVVQELPKVDFVSPTSRQTPRRPLS